MAQEGRLEDQVEAEQRARITGRPSASDSPNVASGDKSMGPNTYLSRTRVSGSWTR